MSINIKNLVSDIIQDIDNFEFPAFMHREGEVDKLKDEIIDSIKFHFSKDPSYMCDVLDGMLNRQNNNTAKSRIPQALDVWKNIKNNLYYLVVIGRQHNFYLINLKNGQPWTHICVTDRNKVDKIFNGYNE